MERVGGITAVRRRVRERADDVVVLVVRARPPVREHQRQRRGSHARLVHEVHAEALEPGGVEDGTELRQRVEHLLAGSPVEAVGPERGELPQVPEVGPVVPARAFHLVGPARAGERGTQVVEIVVGNGDAKRCDGHCSALLGTAARHDRLAPTRHLVGDAGCGLEPLA